MLGSKIQLFSEPCPTLRSQCLLNFRHPPFYIFGRSDYAIRARSKYAGGRVQGACRQGAGHVRASGAPAMCVPAGRRPCVQCHPIEHGSRRVTCIISSTKTRVDDFRRSACLSIGLFSGGNLRSARQAQCLAIIMHLRSTLERSATTFVEQVRF